MAGISGIGRKQVEIVSRELLEDLHYLNQHFSIPRARLDLSQLEEFKQLVGFVNLNGIHDEALKLMPSSTIVRLQYEVRKL